MRSSFTAKARLWDRTMVKSPAMKHPEDPRSDPRANVFLMGLLCAPNGSGPVRVRNLSAHGALLEGPNLPEEGATMILKRGSLAASGEIAWSKDQHCGVRFDRPIRLDEWVVRGVPLDQQRIDAVVAEFRGAPSTSNTLPIFVRNRTPPEAVRRIIEDLLKTCERMADLSAMSIQIAEELLKIEASARRIEILASSAR